MHNDNTIFDDVFRTMLEKMPQLVIPIINEIFHTSYSEEEEIDQYRNEHHTKSGEIITDSYFGICDKLYHLECESRPKGNMSIRMIEYDFAMALENAAHTNETYEINFPYSCVLYLRHTVHTPDVLKVKVNLPDNRHFLYLTPIIKLQEYTREEIFRKRLLFFLPFYIMRYEKELPDLAKNPEKISRLLAEYKKIRFQLKSALPDDRDAAVLTRLAELTERISDYILKSEQTLKERIGDIMGGKVLELETDKILAQAHEKGLSEGREQGLEQGLEKATLRFVENMLAENEPLEKICMYTGCSMPQVLRFKERWIQASHQQNP